MKIVTTWLAAACAVLLGLSAVAGEVIGNTFISEKFGYLEINAPDGEWEISDTESQGSGYQLAELKYKSTVKGADVSVTIWGSPNPNNILDADFYIKTVREAYEGQGMTVEPVDSKRFAGKKVYFLRATLEQNGVKVYSVAYMFAGNGGYFWAQHVARPEVYDESIPLVEKMLEGIKAG